MRGVVRLSTDSRSDDARPDERPQDGAGTEAKVLGDDAGAQSCFVELDGALHFVLVWASPSTSTPCCFNSLLVRGSLVA